MKKADVIKQYTTPIAAPAFVQGPHRFKRREYLNITYRTDREALAKLVPEPLEIDQRTSTKESHLDQQSRFATKVVRRRPPIRRSRNTRALKIETFDYRHNATRSDYQNARRVLTVCQHLEISVKA